MPIYNGSTIEVPDSVPKREYYTTLRRFGTMEAKQGSVSGGSLFGGASGGAVSGPVTAVGSPYLSATMGRSATVGRSNTSASNFKPSGKSVDCAVIMLDGLQQMFSIDVSKYFGWISLWKCAWFIPLIAVFILLSVAFASLNSLIPLSFQWLTNLISRLPVFFQKAAYGQQLFDAVCSNLDLLETDYFGIKYLAPDNTMVWRHIVLACTL